MPEHSRLAPCPAKKMIRLGHTHTPESEAGGDTAISRNPVHSLIRGVREHLQSGKASLHPNSWLLRGQPNRTRNALAGADPDLRDQNCDGGQIIHSVVAWSIEYTSAAKCCDC